MQERPALPRVADPAVFGDSAESSLCLLATQQHPVDPIFGGSVNAFLAAALARVMRVAVPIPAVASASVFHSAAAGGSVVDVVRPL